MRMPTSSHSAVRSSYYSGARQARSGISSCTSMLYKKCIRESSVCQSSLISTTLKMAQCNAAHSSATSFSSPSSCSCNSWWLISSLPLCWRALRNLVFRTVASSARTITRDSLTSGLSTTPQQPVGSSRSTLHSSCMNCPRP
jgi:hypothetical protein